MNERKFHKLIEKQNAEEKEAVRQRLQTELEFCKTAERKSFFVRNKRWLFALAACFVCIAIVVPVSLKYVALNKDIEGGEDQPRYCTSDDYEIAPFDKTLKEYSFSLDIPTLYLDWYDTNGEHESTGYFDIETHEVLCVKEWVFNGETGDDVQIYLIKNNIIMDFVDENIKILSNKKVLDTVSISWVMTSFEAKAYFEYQDYCYYLYFYYPMSEQTIFDVVQQMLETAVAA